MYTFKDKSGREWNLAITPGSIKRVMGSLGINLANPHTPDQNGETLSDRLIRDTMLQVEVIWSLVSPLAETRQLSFDAWVEEIDASIMKIAEEKLLESWKDFFLKLGREAVAKVIAQAKTLFDEMQLKGVEQLQRLKTAQGDAIQLLMVQQVDQALSELHQQMELSKGTPTTGAMPPVPLISGGVSGNATESPGVSGSTASI
jgi:hypothetical protein